MSETPTAENWQMDLADLERAEREDGDSLLTAVYTCIGAASMTYKTEAGNEEFDSKTAKEIGDWLVEYIKNREAGLRARLDEVLEMHSGGRYEGEWVKWCPICRVYGPCPTEIAAGATDE